MEYERLSKAALLSVTNTLTSQSEALSHLEKLYRSSNYVQLNLLNSLELMLQTTLKGGKLVICGIGKSFKIGNKMVATLNSLSIQASSLHPSEALHGDLGIIRDSDCLIFVTASGNTPELINLLPHIPKAVPIILLTCSKSSKLSQSPQVKSLLYAELPSHLNEEAIHGLPAPTVSTTLSLAVADAAVLALSEILEDDLLKRKKLFSIKHPGGAIGASLSHLNEFFQGNGQDGQQREAVSSTVSSSSLLSLDQILKSLRSLSDRDGSANFTIASSNSSDDGTWDQDGLARSVKKQDGSKITTLTEIEILTISESRLLKAITLFDFIVKKGPTSMVISSPEVKKLYLEQFAQVEEISPDLWSSFTKQLGESFHPLDI